MSRKGKFDYSATIDAVQAADHLTRLAEGLLAGTISIAAEGKGIHLTPASVVRIKLDANSNAEKGRGRLAVTLSWKVTSEKTVRTLAISSAPPEPEAKPTPESEPEPATEPVAEST